MTGPRVIVAQNHSLGEWFKKAYGDKRDKKLPLL